MKIINKIFEGDPFPVIKILEDGIMRTYYLVPDLKYLNIPKRKTNQSRIIECIETKEIFEGIQPAIDKFGKGIVNILYGDITKSFKGYHFRFIENEI